MGSTEALARLTVIETLAECEGPGGSFQTRVVSARDGRMHFEQLSSRGPFSAGIGPDGAWTYDAETDQYTAVDAVTASFLRGHELHMLVLAPETRLRAPELLGEREFAGEAVWAVRFLDQLDGEVEIYYSVDSGLPVGMKNVNHTGRGERDVFVRFGDWRDFDGVLLFADAVFTQGADEYVYDFVEFDLDPGEERLERDR